MIRHLLVDLDGTLLGVSMERFVPRMVASMREHFRDVMREHIFLESLKKGLRSMMAATDGGPTLQEVFVSTFAENASIPENTAEEMFSSYYRGPFRDMRSHASTVKGATQLLNRAKDLGCRITLATNPIFPREAIVERVSWAGVDNSLFGFITSAEEMHSCKPYPAYYHEIMDRIGADPRECLMAGNDLNLDLAAKNAGIRFFLVEEGFVSGTTRGLMPDHRGTLSDLADLLSAE